MRENEDQVELDVRYDKIPKPKVGDIVSYYSDRYGYCEGEITHELEWFFGRRYRVYSHKCDRSEVVRFKQMYRWVNDKITVAWSEREQRFKVWKNAVYHRRQNILTDALLDNYEMHS